MLVWVAAAGAGAIVVVVIVLFNRLVRARNGVQEGWAQVDAQLAMRADLVGSLVESVKGYAAHERETLEAAAAARAEVVAAAGPAEAERADEHLERSSHRLVALAEAYPDLKADQAFLDLQARLSGLEDDIAASRRYYNALVRRYHDTIQSFPSLVVARVLGFSEAPYFRLDAP